MTLRVMKIDKAEHLSFGCVNVSVSELMYSAVLTFFYREEGRCVFLSEVSASRVKWVTHSS